MSVEKRNRVLKNEILYLRLLGVENCRTHPVTRFLIEGILE